MISENLHHPDNFISQKIFKWIKNYHHRRDIFKSFYVWTGIFIILNKLINLDKNISFGLYIFV